MYKKKKVEISFEVVEWVDDDSDNGYGNNVDEWLDHLKTLVNCLDYRVEYEVDGSYERMSKYWKLKNTGAKIEITDAGCLLEDETNEDELWEKYGDDGYYQFKAFDTFVDVAEGFLKERGVEVIW
jgi:hypothetical protein